MLKIRTYINLTQIYESDNSIVYRGLHAGNTQPVIVKLLKAEYPLPEQIARYKLEYEITRNLFLEGTVRAYGLEKYQNSFIIILEDFGGESLKILMNQQKLAIQDFFIIAIKITEILGLIHQKNIIHKDINSSNIVYNSATGQVKIIDFGISTVLSRETQSFGNPNILEGTLAYMSPEQTGRMNRIIDYRTDFYSLGVTFYEMLTGQLPFNKEDAMEVIHCHIAKQPVPPCELKPEIPQAVSDIVMKLLSKMAEDRYQSAWGIKADLEECLHQWQNHNTISQFPLGQQDIFERFEIPQKLYGRESETEVLLTAFERVSIGKSEIMLVTGYSGIGKSALVQEIYKPITQKRGYFISGKFDQFQKNIPYAAIVSAFNGLIRLLLSESEAQLNLWRTKILAACGANTQVIIDVIPEVELIVGQQPSVPELGLSEAQNRFNLVFQNFIRVFCTPEHPLVIFLDDLQWADSGTLKLIELIMTDTDIQYLFLIGAYRDNEVSLTHPLMMMVDGLEEVEITINYITLKPLDIKHIIQIIADTLHSDNSNVKSLAELVMSKTKGNPFFVNQFLKTLQSENLISFDFESHIWQWDITQIQGKKITDNVVELMIGKLKKLPESTQQVLSLASCVGADFDLNTISIICEKSPQEIFSFLIVAVQAELIIGTSDLDTDLLIQDYKFLHDRVQQAAYALIDEEEKQAVNLKIGRLLLENIKDEELESKIFDIVNHFNNGLELVSDHPEKNLIAKLNLKAGKIARAATAYESASQYLYQGIELLPIEPWQSMYDTTFQLYFEKAQCEYLLGNPEQADQLFKISLENTKSNLEAADIYDIQMQIYFTQGKFADGIRIGKESLKMFGIIIENTEEDIQIQEQQESEQVRSLLATKTQDEILNQAAINDAEKIACMKLMVFMWAHAMLLTKYHLVNLITLLMVKISLTHGNCDISAYAYSCYGGILAGNGEYTTAYEYGILSLKLSEKYNNIILKGKVINYFCHFINPFKRHLKTSVDLYRTSYQACLECGDVVYGVWAAFFYIWNRFLKGDLLNDIYEQTKNYYNFIFQTKDWNMLNVLLLQRAIVLNLQGLTENANSLSSENFNETQCLESLTINKFDFGLAYYTLFKLQVLVINEEYLTALNFAQKNYALVTGFSRFFIVTEFYFYYSLTLIGVYPQVTTTEQAHLWETLISNQLKMKKWTDECPDNFLHKYKLIDAEIARISGDALAAMDLYDQAIFSARNQEFIQYEALANELAAKFWLGKGKEEFAQIYIKQAHYGYQIWGAKRKVEDLEAKYPQLLSKSSVTRSIKNKGQITTRVSTTSGSGQALDIATVLKASQAISGEILIDKLLSSLMKILIENAGAQKGYLILNHQGKLVIQAEGSLDSEQVNVKQFLPFENSCLLAEAVVNYVARARQSLVLNDATSESKFSNDSYIQANHPKSILCVPLINQGNLISIVYLENNLTIGAFTPERVEILKLLSGQAAISIQNSQLYTEVLENESRLAQLNQAYARFVPREFLQFLNKNSIVEVELGDQVQLEMSVFFSDIRSFTSLSESMTPKDNFKFINAYLQRMQPAIIENKGFIDKYIGDAIMALFSGEADNAVKAGISMLQRLEDYNQYRVLRGYAPIQNGIGINTGSLMLGTVGGLNRMDGTVISDAVNLASRIEELTKNYGISLLISQSTFAGLQNRDNYAIRMIDTVTVKGKSQSITVYEVFEADLPAVKEGKLATAEVFLEALSLYNLQQFQEAEFLFQDCLRRNSADTVAQIYLQRCQNHLGK